jgi:F-type H+-transporting ATPase subunit alpha
VRRFESELLEFMRASHPEILDHVRTTGSLPDEAPLHAALQAFKDSFVAMVGD